MTDQNLCNTVKAMLKGKVFLCVYIRKKKEWKSNLTFYVKEEKYKKRNE